MSDWDCQRSLGLECALHLCLQQLHVYTLLLSAMDLLRLLLLLLHIFVLSGDGVQDLTFLAQNNTYRDQTHTARCDCCVGAMCLGLIFPRCVQVLAHLAVVFTDHS